MVYLIITYPIMQLLMGNLDITERVTVFGINVNIVGIFLVYGALILINEIPNTRHKMLFLFLAILFLFFSFLTGSKKAFFTCIFGIFLLLLLKSNNTTKLIRNMIIAFIIVIGIIYLSLNVKILYNMMGYRIESFFNYLIENSTFIDDKSTWGRSYLIQWAREIFMENPVLGCGIGNFQYLNSLGKYAHNNYWELLANLGLVGFILYYMPFINLLILNIKERFFFKNIKYNFSLTMIILILMIDYANVTYTNELFTILIGAIFSISNLYKIYYK